MVLGFTLWVGYIGLFRPEEILRALPWPMPPLHARFVGALYLSATTFLALAALARSWQAMRTIAWMALVWTGWLLLVTLLHWDSFDFARRQVWFWVFAYIGFPIVAAWLIVGRGAPIDPAAVIRMPAVVACLRVQGLVLVALGAVLFFFPGWVTTIWPWKISPFLAQVYSGPVLGYGAGALVMAARRSWTETIIATVGMLVFALLALAGSREHLALFTPGSASMLLWFGALTLLAAVSVAILAASRRRRGMFR